MARESSQTTDSNIIVLEDIPNKEELTENKINKVVTKKWKTHGRAGAEKVSAKLQKSRTKRKMTPAQLVNLRQFREQDESSDKAKKASLEQLRIPIPEEIPEEEGPKVEFPPEILEADMLRKIMTQDEQKFFIRRWQEYMDEHIHDFNRAEDYDTIVELIMSNIQLYRIDKKQKNAPTLAYDKNVDTVKHNVHIRIRNLRIDLRTRRKDRLETKETHQNHFLNLITDLAKDGQTKLRDQLETRLLTQMQLETDMIKRKKEREKIIDADIIPIQQSE